MSKHTPGPWKFDEDAVFTSVEMEGDIVCFLPNPYEYAASAAQWPANRHLVAAAPDLLAVAQMVVGDYYEETVYRAAVAAIAKATGEGA